MADPRHQKNAQATFVWLRTELWLAQALGCPSIFEGITTAEIRRERIRREILSRGLGNVVAGGRAAGKPEVWASLFSRIFGCDLTAEDFSLTQPGSG
jgi:hypothetical protein